MTTTPVKLSLRDIQSLSPDIGIHELEAMIGDNADVFGLFVVAEATGDVPPAISQWLRSPAVCADWLESLALNEGHHQITWWSAADRMGPDSQKAQRLAKILTGIRKSLDDAWHVVARELSPREYDPTAESRATNRLTDRYRPEFDALCERLRASAPVGAEEEMTPQVQRLLNLRDQRFRDLVAEDVQGRNTPDDLAHPALYKRWNTALTELAGIAFGALGLQLPPTKGRLVFAIADKQLPLGMPRADRDAWARRLTFLTHLRARQVERTCHRYQYKSRVAEQVYRPAAQQLRDRYPDEYAEYVAEEASRL